jgi:hypothetical protein
MGNLMNPGTWKNHSFASFQGNKKDGAIIAIMNGFGGLLNGAISEIKSENPGNLGIQNPKLESIYDSLTATA